MIDIIFSAGPYSFIIAVWTTLSAIILGVQRHRYKLQRAEQKHRHSLEFLDALQRLPDADTIEAAGNAIQGRFTKS